MTTSHYSPGVIRNLLESIGERPRKSLSQNFLVNESVISRFVELGGFVEKDLVLEVGPGLGAITSELLGRRLDVTAVEISSKFVELLKNRFGETVRVLESDILHLDLKTLYPGKESVTVLSNLPFQITSPFLSHLFTSGLNFKKIILILQQEVAVSLAASPGEREYSSLSVFAQFHSKVEYAFKVLKGNFWPVPQTEAAAIVMTPHLLPDRGDLTPFFRFVRDLFSMRRKMIRASMKKLGWGQIPADLGIDPEARPEELSPTEFWDLYNTLTKQG